MRAHVLAMHPDASPPIPEELAVIADECSSSAHDRRQLLSPLRQHEDGASPSFVGPFADADTLEAAVEEQAERLRAHGFMAATEVRVGPLSPARAATLTKVTVEATTNMIKHAPAGTLCQLSVTDDGGDLLAVLSNRTLARKVNPRRLGHIGIEERDGLLRGTCTLDRDGGWWHVRVRFPRGFEATHP